VKTGEDRSTHDVMDAIREVFDEYRGYAKLPPKPKHTSADTATVYNLADHHLGMFSWGTETGEDYDLKISEEILLKSMGDLVALSPNSKTAVILNLGDFFHGDNSENRTPKSGNSLDVDTRYAKMLRVGVKLLIKCIELALQKHTKVYVRCLPGNHDPQTSLALSIALDAFFDGNNRVEVDCDPGPFWYWRFGKVFIGATHGHMVKPEAMPGLMASQCAEDWGASEFRYAYLGHVHHRSKGGGELHGVVWETFQTLATKDAWHHASGYSSGRSMTAITHHREHGEIGRHTVSITPHRKKAA
jgi:hypothetical protein